MTNILNFVLKIKGVVGRVAHAKSSTLPAPPPKFGTYTCLGLGRMLPPIIFIVCGPITTKFCTGIENQSISSNIGKNLHKINDVIDNDVIIVRKLVEKTVKRV